ncbi:hypothetical protein KDN24_10875 [Bacillus sp. Bva_UNVM-123]|uniref:tetratricopeptide repeat protein n=1 Tax=Bacillus sp. Bva_UNVM-123 TaxID=2829798 RepID=UPI00391F08C0
MKKERIMPTEMMIKDQKRSLIGNVVKVAIFAGSKIIHVKIADKEDFYLIFFRDSFVYGDYLEVVEEGSFISKGFQEGFVIDASNPFLSALIPKKSVSILNRGKLFSHLKLHFSPQEIAYIATTLDSFFQKDILIKIIEQIYFEYRRSGKFMRAYQILIILTEFMPELQSAKERLASIEYTSYDDFYHSSSLQTIFKKDPLFIEIHCFKNRSHPKKHQFLEEMLTLKNRFPEIILLWLEKTRKVQELESIRVYTQIALKCVSMEDWIITLVHEKINPYIHLPEAKPIIDGMISEGEYEKAAKLLLHFMDELPAAYDSALMKLWENVDVEFVISHFALYQAVLEKQINKKSEEHLEEQMNQLITNLFKRYDLKTICEKMLPFMEIMPHSKILNQLRQIGEIAEDPDRMLELGDFYFEYKQYDLAIECYSWEMELSPQSPEPVAKISKVYQHKGMGQEAAAYQKVYTQMKEREITERF